jgi:hypothetical protein
MGAKTRLLVWSAWCAGLGWAVGACGDGAAPGGAADLDADGDTDGDTDGDSDSDADGDTDGDSDGDTDADTDADAESCRHVDVVIAIDPSSSMTEELVAMREDVFPAFAERLATISEDLDDFRVATLDGCPLPCDFHTEGESTGDCGFSSGEAWIDSSSPAIDEEFACVGDLLVSDHDCTGENDDEQPASSALCGLEDADGLNEGFLRDDAILVVIAMTDEDEQPTIDGVDGMADLYDRLVALKGGVNNMVFYGIGCSAACTGLYGDCLYEAASLVELTDMFIDQDRGVWNDLCSASPLEDGLDAVFAVIEEACEEYIPIE